MPNPLAYLMLVLWPIVTIVLFRRLPLERAIIWTLLGGYLLLPRLTEFNLPLVPSMNKDTIPSLMALLACLFLLRRRVSFLPGALATKLLIILFCLTVIPTAMTNPEPIIFATEATGNALEATFGYLPPLGLRDMASMFIAKLFALIPFFLAHQFLGTDKGLRELMRALIAGALVYSVPALVEVAISPQLHIWIYGFFQHNFDQTMRGGGFRPIVFLEHPLWVAFFFMTAIMSTATFFRLSPPPKRPRLLLILGYLFGVLVLCKSLASFGYAVCLVPLLLLGTPRQQVVVVLGIAGVAILYPVLRNTGVIPVDAILAQVEQISADRAQSLGYRFGNEDIVLARAAEKPWFGWGGWGRELIREEYTGRILTVLDGRWIIVFAQFGWSGYIAETGLLALPLVLVSTAVFRRRAGLSPLAVPLALMLAVTLFDMLLNAILTPYTWLIAGAITAHLHRLNQPAAAPRPRQSAKAPPARKRRRTVM